MILLKIDIDTVFIIITLIMIGISIVYIFLDVHYFIRMIFTMWCVRLFQSKLKLTDTDVIYGICTTNDVDIYWQQMNNARYIRDLDFARSQFSEKTGLYTTILNLSGSLTQNTIYIQYRRPILLFTPYRITTKLIYWDDKDIYFEHEFINFNDDIVYAIVISKQSCIGLNLHELICSILETNISERPIKPEKLEYLCQCTKVQNLHF